MQDRVSPEKSAVYFLWQEPAMEQWAQLEPQLDLPCRLSRIRLAIITATSAISPAQSKIVT